MWTLRGLSVATSIVAGVMLALSIDYSSAGADMWRATGVGAFAAYAFAWMVWS